MLKPIEKFRFIAIGLLFVFLVNTIGPAPFVQAQEVSLFLSRQRDFLLPAPGVMVNLSPAFAPPILKGIKVHADNPFRFEFILDQGDNSLPVGRARDGGLKEQATRLIKYFLAALTIPEKDLWVNLSPYERNRIIPESFGQTEMGRDLLAEDYLLKQITASLIYPEGETGKKFWQRIYAEAARRFGTTQIPVNTFNKVWIVPEKAAVYENAKAGTAYVIESRLKVMLEEDYLSLQKHEGIRQDAIDGVSNKLGSQVLREIVIPELAKEVNQDRNFSQLRQVYNSLILAYWYKNKVKDSILTQVFSARNKIAGMKIDDPKEKEKIYLRYLQAFKKGVYNYIKEEQDLMTREIVPKRYFSGGTAFPDKAMSAAYEMLPQLPKSAGILDHAEIIQADIRPMEKSRQTIINAHAHTNDFAMRFREVVGNTNNMITGSKMANVVREEDKAMKVMDLLEFLIEPRISKGEINKLNFFRKVGIEEKLYRTWKRMRNPPISNLAQVANKLELNPAQKKELFLQWLKENPVNTKSKFGEDLVIARVSRGLSLSKLSELTKLRVDLISEFETKGVIPSRYHFDILKSVLDELEYPGDAAMNVDKRAVLVPEAVDYRENLALDIITDEAVRSKVKGLLKEIRALLKDEDIQSGPQLIQSLFGERHEEITQILVELSSLIRTEVSYHISREFPMAPLRYAVKNHLLFKIAENIYISPVTESFRRHLIFKTDKNGRINFAYEFMFAGENKKKLRIFGLKRKTIAADVNQNFPGSGYSVNVLLFRKIPYKNHLLYGKAWKSDYIDIAVYEYPFDGKRANNTSLEIRSSWASELGISLHDLDLKIVQKAFECYFSLKFLGYLGWSDMHGGNLRIALIYDEHGRPVDIKVQLVADYGAFLSWKFRYMIGIFGAILIYLDLQTISMISFFSLPVYGLVSNPDLYYLLFYNIRPGLRVNTSLSLKEVGQVYLKAWKTVFDKMPNNYYTSIVGLLKILFSKVSSKKSEDALMAMEKKKIIESLNNKLKDWVGNHAAGRMTEKNMVDLVKYLGNEQSDLISRLTHDYGDLKEWPTRPMIKLGGTGNLPTIWILGWRKIKNFIKQEDGKIVTRVSFDSTPIHSHGDSRAVIYAFQGSIFEEKFEKGMTEEDRVQTLIKQGSIHEIPAPYIHLIRAPGEIQEGDVRLGLEPLLKDGEELVFREVVLTSVSIHLYDPPLTLMDFYENGGGGHLMSQGQWVDKDPAMSADFEGREVNNFIKQVARAVGKDLPVNVNEPGGIDLTFAKNLLQTQNADQAIKFHLDAAQLAQLQNAPGFVPVIINIRPLKDLSAFLGISPAQAIVL